MAFPESVRKDWAAFLLDWIENDVDRSDPVVAEAEVARNCGEASEALLELLDVLAKRRAMAVRMMDRQGLSRAQIAVAMNISRQRVSQILNR